MLFCAFFLSFPRILGVPRREKPLAFWGKPLLFPKKQGLEGQGYRRYGPDTEIQYRPRDPHGLAKTSRILSKREADTEFQYRPHIVDTEIPIADAIFADAISEAPRGIPSRGRQFWKCSGGVKCLELYMVRGIPAVLLRGIPGNALGSFRNLCGIASGKSQPYWG